MFPGTISKRSIRRQTTAATIGVDADILVLKGTTQINTITGAYQEYGQKVTLIPADGAVILGTTGNILVGVTLAQNRAVDLIWVPELKKWVIAA